MDLIIVESPKKAKTITHYLKNKYCVLASFGHVIDLPKKGLGIDVERHFIPDFEVIPGKEKVLSELKKRALSAQTVYLATDPDREGEAIAYHIREYLLKSNKKITLKRLEFHEITIGEIQNALKNPKEINQSKVESQFTRRIIDRLMGFSLSPFLWKALGNYKLSAGRVQSVVLRFICEKEEEIAKFESKTYYDMKAHFEKDGIEFEAVLMQFDSLKPPFLEKEKLDELKKKLSKEFQISQMIRKESKLFPKPPFTTSELQKEAFLRFRFPSAKTMLIAQKLYEGVDTGKGATGLITYMRTDSVRVSDVAMNQNRAFIKAASPDLLSEKPRFYSNKKNTKVQDAHEAIRPANIAITPKSVENHLSPDEYKLYSLIWRRFTASQMKDSVYEDLKIILKNSNTTWEIKGRKRLFDGFERFYPTMAKENLLPSLLENEKLIAKDIKINKKVTPPPPRYTEATLIEKMEKTGIGRPSTYAPTIKLLLDRKYVDKEKNSFYPTAIGKTVNRILVDNFNPLVSGDFTAKMEDDLDLIESQDSSRLHVVKNFYHTMRAEISKAEVKIKDATQPAYKDKLKEDREAEREYKETPCPKCGHRLVKRKSKGLVFWGCEGYPKCKYAESDQSMFKAEPCPKCGKRLMKRKGKFGYFWACEGYPDCKFAESIKKGFTKKSGMKKDRE